MTPRPAVKEQEAASVWVPENSSCSSFMSPRAAAFTINALLSLYSCNEHRSTKPVPCSNFCEDPRRRHEPSSPTCATFTSVVGPPPPPSKLPCDNSTSLQDIVPVLIARTSLQDTPSTHQFDLEPVATATNQDKPASDQQDVRPELIASASQKRISSGLRDFRRKQVRRNTNQDALSAHQQYARPELVPGTTGSSQKDSITKARRARTVFSDFQLKRLEGEFKNQFYLAGAGRRNLATELGLNDTKVKVWFQNRRIKWRKDHNGEELRRSPTDPCNDVSCCRPSSV